MFLTPLPDALALAPVATDGRVFCYFGDRKTGKSYLARRLVLESVAIDEEDEDGDDRRVIAPMALAIYVTPNTESTDPWPGPTLAAPPATLDARTPRAFAMRGGAAYEQAAEWIMLHCTRRRIVFLVDEAHRVWPENFSPRSKMAELFHEGRHRGVDLHVISQWPSRIDKRLVYAADETRWFRLHHPRTLEWIAGEYSREAGQQVAGLPRRKWITVLEDNPPPEWRWKWTRKETTDEPVPQDPRSGRRGGRGLSPVPRQAGRGDPALLSADTDDTED